MKVKKFDRNKKIITFLICLQLVSIGIIVKQILDKRELETDLPLAKQYLEYAFVDYRFDVTIFDKQENDITEKFLAENLRYYEANDWDKILDNFKEESGSMSIDDKCEQ